MKKRQYQSSCDREGCPSEETYWSTVEDSPEGWITVPVEDGDDKDFCTSTACQEEAMALLEASAVARPGGVLGGEELLANGVKLQKLLSGEITAEQWEEQ